MIACEGANPSFRTPMGPVRRSDSVISKPASNGDDLTSAQSSGEKLPEMFALLINASQVKK